MRLRCLTQREEKKNVPGTKLEDRGTMVCEGERATTKAKSQSKRQKAEATRKTEEKAKQATIQQSRVRNMDQVRSYAGAEPGI